MVKIANRKGWLRILESGIAALIIIGVIFMITNERDISSSFDLSSKMKEVLDEAAKDNLLRKEILANQAGVESKLEALIKDKIGKPRFSYKVKICDINENCLLIAEIGKAEEIASVERVISTSFDSPAFSPKKIKVFVKENIFDTYEDKTISNPPVPTNENVLCLYNSNSVISKDICDYYEAKRPGSSKLGLALPDSIFVEDTHKEISKSSADIITYISTPLLNYVNSHPELKITHLAIAKDIPIKYFPEIPVYFQGRPLGFSTNFLISLETDFNRYKSINQFPPFVNNYVDNNKHFNPNSYTGDKSIPHVRFVASFLTGYTLEDIKKMIDRAQEPAPDLSNVKWVVDRDVDGFSVSENNLKDIQTSLYNKGIPLENIVLDRQNIETEYINCNGDTRIGCPKMLGIGTEDKIIAYLGPGSHHTGYPGPWMIYGLFPLYGSKVASRAIITSVESFNAYTFTGNNLHRDNGVDMVTGYQGKLADAITSNTFGGTAHSSIFSGALGYVDEPWANLIDNKEVFSLYLSGLTLAESPYNTDYIIANMFIVVGDPLMRINDNDKLLQ